MCEAENCSHNIEIALLITFIVSVMKYYHSFTLWTLLSVNSAAAAVVDTDVIDNVASSEAIHNKASNLRKVKGGRTTASTTDENILHRNKDRALKSKSKKSWTPPGEDNPGSCTSNASFYECAEDHVAICYKHEGKTHYHNKCVSIDDEIFGKVPGVHTYKDNHPLIKCGCFEEGLQ